MMVPDISSGGLSAPQVNKAMAEKDRINTYSMMFTSSQGDFKNLLIGLIPFRSES
jgi:hypothetical protein